MANLEDALVDRCLKRARDYGGVPFTKQRLASRCFSDISMHGPEANTSVRLKGTRGLGLKRQRRLFPSGPLGVIRYAEPGVLEVEFPSVELLTALDGRHTTRRALAAFFTGPSKAFPDKMPVAVALQYLVSERHAKLLRHFDQADDAGKLFIEQSAVLAAAPRPQPAPHQ